MNDRLKSIFFLFSSSLENVQEGEGDLGRQGADRHPDLRASRQTHQEARLRSSQVRVGDEGNDTVVVMNASDPHWFSIQHFKSLRIRIEMHGFHE